MARPEDHLEQAARNEAAATYLATDGYYDWAITSLFYAVLHMVQAYFLRSQMIAETHFKRESQMAQNETLRPLLDLYMRLKARGENARYECWRPSLQDYSDVRLGLYIPLVNSMRTLDSR